MNDVASVSDEEVSRSQEDEVKARQHYDQFFCKDNVTISVKSVYRHHHNPKNLDRMALITQLKEIAKARGYNVTESESNFTRTKYIHFKKYRLDGPVTAAPLMIPDAPKPEDVVLDV